MLHFLEETRSVCFTMNNRKIMAIMMTTSMLAAAFAGCLGGDDEEEEWALTVASDVNAEFVTSDWTPIIPNLNADTGMCDAILSAMTINDERDEVVDFTRAYYTSAQGVIGGSAATAITDVASLNAAGTTIAVQSGTTSDLYAAESLGLATIQAYEGWPEVIAAVNDGTAHYAIGDAPVVALEGTLMTTFSPENFGIAVRDEADNELEDALNVALTAIVASGEYDAHLEAWFPGTSGTLVDTTTAATATAYPMPTEGSTLTEVLESGTLKFCSDTTYPPFESLDASGNAVGFDVDIGHAIVDEIAEHYANVADATVLGCTDSDNPGYDAAANLDDGTCVAGVKIGFLLDQTSPAISAYASNFMAAAQIAINDLNAIENGAFFELVAGDTACSEAGASASAQTLAASGVVGVAGAACSSASMAANAVLAPLGIPMVSYASTSPDLSNSETYPNFFRVVPSDALHGPAMASMVVAVGMQGGAPNASTSMMAMNPALVHMTNDYGSGLAGAFEGAWLASSGQSALCAKIGYDPADATTSYAGMAQQVDDAGCGSVVTVTYAADGADFMEALRGLGSTIPAFGGDGIASEDWISEFSAPAAANTVFATKPRASTGAGAFAADCAADDACAGGIYTGETYDAISIIGKAYNMEAGANMASHIGMVGVNYTGASGTVHFDAVGDIPGAGYDICMHAIISSTDTYLNCQHYWTAEGGVQEYVFSGLTIKLGMLLDQTSPAISAYAGGFVASSQIALAIMNAAGYSNGLQFEIVYADTACSPAGATAGAQTLAAAGVVGVVGAACSSASMAANAVLSPLGIPMISYASTSPALSDNAAYPNFFRVVPSDAQQGQAMSDVITAGSSVATVHMSNDYGTGLANAFANEWSANNESMCQTSSYNHEEVFDSDAIAQQIMDNSCDAVFLVSYAADGEQLLSSLATMGYDGAIYGGDGVADSNFAGPEGMIATKPGANPNAGDSTPSERAQAFAALCGANADCAGGIYTGETFDSFIVLGYSVFAGASQPGVPLSSMISAVAQGFVGATGSITFMANGDLMGGSGYCVGSFDADSVFTCNQHWSIADGLTDITSAE